MLLQLVQPPTARCGEHGPQRADRLEGALTHARSGRQLQLLMPQSTRQIAHVCAGRRSGGSVDSVGVSLLEAPHDTLTIRDARMCTALLSWVVRVWSATEIRLAKWAVALSSEWPMSMHSQPADILDPLEFGTARREH